MAERREKKPKPGAPGTAADTGEPVKAAKPTKPAKPTKAAKPAAGKPKGPKWLGSGEPLAEAEPLPPHELEAAITDGLLIARFSVVLTLKNRLIVSALRDDRAFDPEAAAAMAGEELRALAAEQDRNAEHTAESIFTAGSQRGAARHEHDYKARDIALLAARQSVYAAVGSRARDDARNPERLAELVEDARVRAWEEISRELTGRLDAVGVTHDVVVDADYLAHRDARMRHLREIDLWELADARHVSPRGRKKR